MRRRYWIGLLAGGLAFVSCAVVTLLNSQVGGAIFSWIINTLITSIKAALWLWICTFVFFIAALVFFYRSRFFAEAFNTSTNLLVMDDSMMSLLSFVSKADDAIQMRNVLKELLHDACEELGPSIHRASILLPSEPDGEYLTIWASHRMPEETIHRTKFYIGTDHSKRILQGVAGSAFLKSTLSIAHFTQIKGIWHCDNPNYIHFTEQEGSLAYRSFACVPVIGPSFASKSSDSIICLGVVCFDSWEESSFDKSTSGLLPVFARRIAFILRMEVLLREVSAPDAFVTYMHSLVSQPIDYYTCFISYSSRDQPFAERLYADLRSKGVRCWFAPEDMKIGDEIRIRIDESIRRHDKLLLVLSQHSIESEWVGYEVEAALAKERREKRTVLFPVRLDQTIKESTTAWAAHIQTTRHIGNFEHWKNYEDYQKALDRLLRDLKQA